MYLDHENSQYYRTIKTAPFSRPTIQRASISIRKMNGHSVCDTVGTSKFPFHITLAAPLNTQYLFSSWVSFNCEVQKCSYLAFNGVNEF